MRSIRDNDFDVFGLNECSTGIQEYLTEELGSDYNFSFFSPYSQGGTGDKAQGLAYRKGFTLDDWHYFWLSGTPAVMTTNDGNMNRGGCCGTLTRTADGKKLFVMVTHGALSAETRSQYASLYRQMEEQYNTGGYPSFFVGDMNARPSDPASEEYRSYWTDAYDGVGSSGRTGAYATYNGFDLTRNMYSYEGRIDYIYYRKATPLNYMCNNTLYDGCYASDHLPVRADFRLE